MVELIEIPFEEIPDLVRLGFGNDPELMSKYQQLDTDFETTVSRNIENIESSAKLGTLIYYLVQNENEKLGFTVVDVENYLLVSFGINIKFRTKKVVTEWFMRIKMIFEDGFGCVLWNKNKRAIQFLERQGMTIENKNDELTVLMIK